MIRPGRIQWGSVVMSSLLNQLIPGRLGAASAAAGAVMAFFLAGVFANLAFGQKPVPDQLQPFKPMQIKNLDQGGKWVPPPNILRLSSSLPTDEELQRVEISPEVLALVVGMGDPSWLGREQAMKDLVELEVADDVILAVLSRVELDAEQRERLLEIISSRIKNAPRGAIGIRMRRVIGRDPGVQIEAVLEGLPAKEFLKVGDRIVGIDGYAIVTSEDLTAIVQSKLPGEEIKVDVLRDLLDEKGDRVLDEDGRTLKIEVNIRFPLGSVTQLDQSGGVSSSTRVEAVRIRRVKMVHARFAVRPLRIRTPLVLQQYESYAGRSPDSHVSVIWLNRRLELEEIGLAEFDIDTRREATQRLTELMVDSGDQQRSDAERKWLDRVLERYIELLPTD